MSAPTIREIPHPARVRETTGARLTRLRVGHGWTQQQLADAAGLAKLTVGMIEREITEPTAATLDVLADALDVCMQGLWKGECCRGCAL